MYIACIKYMDIRAFMFHPIIALYSCIVVIDFCLFPYILCIYCVHVYVICSDILCSVLRASSVTTLDDEGKLR